MYYFISFFRGIASFKKKVPSIVNSRSFFLLLGLEINCVKKEGVTFEFNTSTKSDIPGGNPKGVNRVFQNLECS